MILRHPKSASSPLPEVSPLTFEEFVNLVPSNIPPPPVLDVLLRYRVLIDAQLPKFTAILQARAEKLKAKGFAVPARFLPAERPSREDVLRTAAELYRKMLTERLG